MGNALVGVILALWLAVLPTGSGQLGERLGQWPAWRLPAPLPRPGSGDLVYPTWLEGTWAVQEDGHRAEGPGFRVRFLRLPGGSVVGDRAFNARAMGRAQLGEDLLGVEDDPSNPNRQIARLRGPGGAPLQLESRVIGRRQEQLGAGTFLADELVLQVLHGPGNPRVSRVETLSRFALAADGAIAVEQWQASYPSPAEGLVAAPIRSEHRRFRLQPISSDPPPRGSDPAS
ncbi:MULTISPECIES: DUF6816 family protein [Aphanothece]|uniref:DUF6816 family protein n=1 Tax=Aphanothece TaxID=1121 RepID=UPI00398E52C5